MDIAGHISSQMLARYSYSRMEAKRKALEVIVSKPAPLPSWTPRNPLTVGNQWPSTPIQLQRALSLPP